jgi:hypothetical protein
VFLLLLNQVVVSAKLLEHVRHDHAAAVSLVAEVRELLALGTIGKAQRKERVGFNRVSLGLVNFLPKELAADSRGSDLRHLHLVAGNLATLAPCLQRNIAS